MTVIPVTLKQANEYVLRYHRHHGKVQGCKFCIGVTDENGTLRGVAIVGRPVSRYLDNGVTAEVTDFVRTAAETLAAFCMPLVRVLQKQWDTEKLSPIS